ncbi:MAG: GNAT family N-acetyltransferase [Allosphingosinicella sp.]
MMCAQSFGSSQIDAESARTAAHRRANADVGPELPLDSSYGCKIGRDLFGREGPNLFAADGASQTEADAPLRHNGARIETERLILRPLRLEDFEDYGAMMADPDKFRYSERGPMTSDESWTRLLRNAGHWALMGHGLFAVEEKQSGRFVGEVGLGDYRRGLGTAFDGVPEASWSIVTWAQGRGYATEAAAAAHDWTGTRVHGGRTVCIIHARNHASARVAQKLGYLPFAELAYRGYPSVLFERGWSRTATGRLSRGAGAAQRAVAGKHPGLLPLAALKDLVTGLRRWRSPAV